VRENVCLCCLPASAALGIITLASAEEGKPALTVASLALDLPKMTREVSRDASQKSQSARLCWSGDGKEIYLNSYTRDANFEMTFSHFILKSDGSEFRKVERSPFWVESCWNWKASLQSPGGKAEPSEKKSDAVAASGRGLNSFQNVIPVTRICLGKRTLREQKGYGELKGVCYGWATEGTAILLYAGKKGNLVAIDYEGKEEKLLLKGDYTLPAWSCQADRVAFVETKKGGKGWRIYVASVVAPPPH
jgi:hypothetical protein